MADETRKGPGWVITLALVLAPVLYVLSFGPADYVMKYTGRGVKVVMTVYAPVVWLHDNTPLKGPLESYAELCTPS